MPSIWVTPMGRSTSLYVAVASQVRRGRWSLTRVGSGTGSRAQCCGIGLSWIVRPAFSAGTL